MLYHDLPQEKSTLLTFYNIPMMGVPVDKSGWIKLGRVAPVSIRSMRISKNNIRSPRDVIMEYRPDFQRDPNTVVAGVYADGLFSYLLEGNDDTMSEEWYTISHCDHLVLDEEQPTTRNYITLDSSKPGEATMPPYHEIAIVGPHYTKYPN